MLWCSSCTWREGRQGGNALDSGRVDIVVNDKGLLPVCVLCDCNIVACVSRLQLSLSDRVPVVLVAAAVSFRLSSPLLDRVPVALGGRTSW